MKGQGHDHSLLTAENQYVQVDGARIAHREIGSTTGVPLVLLSRFRATIDDWDPTAIDGLAAERRFIVFDNTGIGFSDGDVQPTVRKMSEIAIGFVEALGLGQVDLLGFSMGGFVAHRFTLSRPDLVRNLVLVGTGAGGGEGAVAPKSDNLPCMAAPEASVEGFQALFFTPDEVGRQGSQTYWDNIHNARRVPESDAALDAAKVQLGAIGAYAGGDDATLPELEQIKQPVLVVNGDDAELLPPRPEDPQRPADHLPALRSASCARSGPTSTRWGR